MNSTHHQAVARVAAPFKVAAVSSDGIIEGLELKPSAARMLPFLLSVQFHPERLVDRYRGTSGDIPRVHPSLRAQSQSNSL